MRFIFDIFESNIDIEVTDEGSVFLLKMPEKFLNRSFVFIIDIVLIFLHSFLPSSLQLLGLNLSCIYFR